MRNFLALSIRQPYVERILRGIKKVEYRNRPTKIRGRVYLYAGMKPGDTESFLDMDAKPGDFPTGVLVGTVEVVGCTGKPGNYAWHLANPKRLAKPVKPRNQPQPVWFYPFKSKKVHPGLNRPR